MPAALVPQKDIPALADCITQEQRAVLAVIQRVGFIRNHNLDDKTAAALQELANRGLVDPAYDGPTDGPVHLWTSNGNGQRILRYSTGIRSGPYYELPVDELAAWLEAQGKDHWWSVDGDPLLAGRLFFPCPADELADELRRVRQPLLVQARKEDKRAKGQRIDRDMLDEVAGKIAGDLHPMNGGELPPWSNDRVLYLCWKESTDDWLLCEDSETAKEMQANEEGKAVESAEVKKE